MKHLKVFVEGRVQGVSFRYYTLQKAKQLDVKGFVRNEQNGSVYIEVEGSDEPLGEFISWCHHGPMLARVSNVRIEEGELKGFGSFEILR